MKKLIQYFLQFFKSSSHYKHSYKRIFVAMDIPVSVEQIFRQIEERVAYNLYNEQELEQHAIALRSEPHLHITLAFIGEVEESKIAIVHRALKHVKKIFTAHYPQCFCIKYEHQLKIFGSALVLPIKPTEELLFLHTIIIDTLKNYGIHFKNVHEFSAHTTLSRINMHTLLHIEDGVKKLEAAISLVIHPTDAITFKATAFKLYQSLSGEYNELGSYYFNE